VVDNGAVSDEPPDPRAVGNPENVLATTAPVLAWIADARGAVVWVNDRWEQVTGAGREASLGDRWLEAVHPEDREACRRSVRHALDRREASEVRYRLRTTDGRYRWVLQRVATIPDGDGLGGLVASCTDVDELMVDAGRRDRALELERGARTAAEAAAGLLVRLQRITAAFAAALTPGSVSDVVVAEAIAATDATAGAFFLLEADGRTMCAERAIGYPDDIVDVYRSFSTDDDLPAAEAVRTSRPVFIGDIDRASAVVRSIAVRGGRRAAAALPLLVGGRSVGALILSFAEEQPFDTVEREFLEAVALQCAVALERTRLYQAEQEGRRAAEQAQHRLGFLAEATRALASSLDRRQILRRLTRLSVSHVCDLIAIWLPHEGSLRRVVTAHRDLATEDELVRRGQPVSVPLGSEIPMALCFATGHEQLLEVDEGMRVRSGLPPEMANDPRFKVHTTLLVPITARGRVLGVMSFSLIDPDRSFSDADVAVALELGARAGGAMENAELYEREHSMAEILQHAILPQSLPLVPGFELAARYLPATSGVEVGGDWYDAFPLDDGRIGVAVGDVAGHGLRAAAIMGQLRNGLRAYAIDGAPPSRVVAKLNRLLTATERDTIATLVYGILDPSTGSLQWSCAGHPPPITGTATGASHLLSPVGLVLGVDEDAEYSDAEFSIAPGSSLLLYTDGLVERREEHLDDGFERLRLTVERAGDVGVEQLCRRVIAGMVGDDRRGDDVCLLGLWRRPLRMGTGRPV
jgi:PAS domain S-box-containing protein